MAIGTPASLGVVTDNVGSGSDPVVLTTTTAHEADKEIVVLIATRGNRNVSSVTDSVGNTYTQMAVATQGAAETNSKVYIFRSSGAAALPLGGTITVNNSGIGVAVFAVEAVKVSGVANSTDASGTNNNTGNDPSCNITTVAASTITFHVISQRTTLSPTFSEDADYTSLVGSFVANVNTTGMGISMSTGFRIRSSAGADTHDADTALVVSWAEALASLPESTGLPVNASGCSLPMCGVM